MTMTADGITIEDLDGKTVEPEYLEVNWDVTAAQKDGYPHFMIKEIHEQPAAITKTITQESRIFCLISQRTAFRIHSLRM